MNIHADSDFSELVLLKKRIADLEMRESQMLADYEHLQHLYKRAPFCYQSLDESGCLIEVNRAWLNRLGYTRGEVIGQNFIKFLHPEVHLHFKENFPRFKAVGEILGVEFEMVKKDGSSILVSFDGKVANDLEGRFQKTHCIFQEITERRRAKAYREMGVEVLQILNDSGGLQYSIQNVLDVLKRRTGFDAVGIRLQSGDDFPFFAQVGFSSEFLLKENSLVERSENGEARQNKDCNVRLECTCGLVISGEIDATNPYFTKGGSFWTNDSLPLLDIPAGAELRLNPRNQCIFEGYASFALVPIRNKNRIVGLIHFSNKRKGSFTLDSIELLEGIASHIGAALMRKQAEEELQTQQKRLQDIIEFLPDATVAIDKKGRVILWNNAMEKMTGLSTAEMIGKGDYSYSIPFYGEARPQLIDLILENNEEISSLYPHISRDEDILTTEVFCRPLNNNKGAWVFAKASPLRDHAGNIVGAIESIRNITESKQMEETLRKSVAWFKALFNATSDSVILIKSDGVILDLNENAALRRNVCKNIMRGQHLFDFLPPEAAAARRIAIGQLIKKKILMQYNETRNDKYYHIRLFPIMDNEGDVIQVASFSRDITERIQAEAENKKLQTRLIQSQKMEAIGTLAGGIAHDFNNILGAILGYTEMARDATPSESVVARYLDKIGEAGDRAVTLVRQILAFSRQADAKPVYLMPARIIKEAVQLLRPSLPSTIAIKQQIEAVSPLLADPTQIHQVLVNLCTNAFHAMEQTGGALEIIIKERELSQQDLQYESKMQPGKYVELSIGDTGHGIEPEVRNKIFDPYFTTKEMGKGTGMGLSIVHGIVTSHNGFITCESEPGKGTIFHVFFPVDDREIISEVQQVETPSLLGNERILFVDDEVMLVELGKMMLDQLGYTVTVCTSGLEALRTFQNQPEQFDLVITDQTMPSMTGSDLARQLLQVRPDLPIILCTGHSSIISEEKASSLGIKGFVQKPLIKNNFAVLVRKLLDENKLSD